MNCYQHPEESATAFCRSCGRPLCPACQYPAEGTVFCYEHVPATAYAPPQQVPAPPPYPDPAMPFGAPAAAPGLFGEPAVAPNPYATPIGTMPVQPVIRTSPGLAFLLGLIPGVGAIYNGQYVKGIVHALVFGLMASIMDHNGSPFLGMGMAALFFYMPFEAYHTAKKRQMGIHVDEWSSIVVLNSSGARSAIGPVILITVGILFLLDSLHVVSFSEIGRFWPLLLIGVGVFMLYGRLSGAVGNRSGHWGKFNEK